MQNPFFTIAQYDQLIRNGGQKDQDHRPVAKLHIPGTNYIWLLTALDPFDPLCAFGLCDLDIGSTGLGYVDLRELAQLQLHGGKVEADMNFCARYPVSIYARASRHYQRIVEDEESLFNFGRPRQLGMRPG